MIPMPSRPRTGGQECSWGPMCLVALWCPFQPTSQKRVPLSNQGYWATKWVCLSIFSRGPPAMRSRRRILAFWVYVLGKTHHRPETPTPNPNIPRPQVLEVGPWLLGFLYQCRASSVPGEPPTLNPKRCFSLELSSTNALNTSPKWRRVYLPHTCKS